MKYFSYLTGSLILFSLLTGGCKPAALLPEAAPKNLPASFEGGKDTANEAGISWKQFFTDTQLTTLIDTALINNWDILIAWQRIQVASSDILSAKSVLKPALNAVAGADINRYGEYTMNGAGNKNTPIYNGENIPVNLPNYYIGLQTSWEVDLWGKLRNKKQAALSRYLSGVEGKNLVVTTLVAELSNTYYALLALDQSLIIINENIILQENALEIIRVQKEAAVANELAVQQFTAQLLHLKSMRQEVLQQMMETESRINFLTARYPQAIARDSLFFSGKLPVQVKPGNPAALLANRPDIRQAEMELIASRADLRSAKAAFYPTFNINGSVGYQAFKTSLLFTSPESLAFGLFGSLSAPLINRAALKAAFNRANASQLSALYQFQKAVVNGYLEVYVELARIKNLQQVVELKTREAETLTQAIETSAELFKTGRATYLEVLITRQSALQARLELVETKKNQFMATVNLYKALGGGWR